METTCGFGCALRTEIIAQWFGSISRSRRALPGKFAKVGVGPEIVGVVLGGWIETDGVTGALAADGGGNDGAFFAGVVEGDLVPIGREVEIIDLWVFDAGEGIERTGGLGLRVMRIGAGNIARDLRSEQRERRGEIEPAAG